MNNAFQNIELFHVHIPKTAGTSLNAMFERAFGADFCNHDRKRLNSDPSVRAAAGHETLRAARQKFPNAHLVTVLREPESRLKSTIRHLYARRNWPEYSNIGQIIGSLIDKDGRFISNADMVSDSEFKNRFDNLLIRYLTPDPVQDSVTEDHFHSALDAIGSFRHVIFQDRFLEGATKLFEDFGFTEIQEIKKNRAKSHVTLWEEFPDVLAPYLIYDRALYHELVKGRDLVTTAST